MKRASGIMKLLIIMIITIILIMTRIVNVSPHWPLAVSATQMQLTQTHSAHLMRGAPSPSS